MVVVDQGCTKGTVFIPCTTNTGAEEAAALYAIHVWKRFGLPRKIISDRGPQFASKFTRELCRTLGIEQNLSTAYHPQTDGQTERVNQELEQYLRAFCNFQQDNWATLLPYAEFAHNIRYHSSIKESPFKALMGYQPRMLDIQPRGTDIPSVHERMQLISRLRNEVNASSRIAAELVERRNKDRIMPFKEGDKVWLEGKNIRTTHPTAKLALKRYGPFTVTQIVGPTSAKLAIPDQWKIHPVFHASLLTKYQATKEYGEPYSKPPPEEVDGEEEYEVSEVIDSRHHRGKLQYLVRWKGYADADNMWLAWENLKNAPDLVAEFHHKYPTKSKEHHKKPLKGRY